MASAYTEAKELRQNKILKQLSEIPTSVRELEELLGANYYTIRNDIKELQAKGLIHNTGVNRGGSVLYAGGGVPQGIKFRRMSDGVSIEGAHILNGWMQRQNFGHPNASNAVRGFNLVLLQIFSLAIAAQAGEKISASQFNEVRTTITKHLATLNDMTSYYKQLLNLPWQSQEELENLLVDTELINTVLEEYAKFIQTSAASTASTGE